MRFIIKEHKIRTQTISNRMDSIINQYAEYSDVTSKAREIKRLANEIAREIARIEKKCSPIIQGLKSVVELVKKEEQESKDIIKRGEISLNTKILKNRLLIEDLRNNIRNEEDARRYVKLLEEQKGYLEEERLENIRIYTELLNQARQSGQGEPPWLVAKLEELGASPQVNRETLKAALEEVEQRRIKNANTYIEVFNQKRQSGEEAPQWLLDKLEALGAPNGTLLNTTEYEIYKFNNQLRAQGKVELTQEQQEIYAGLPIILACAGVGWCTPSEKRKIMESIDLDCKDVFYDGAINIDREKLSEVDIIKNQSINSTEEVAMFTSRILNDGRRIGNDQVFTAYASLNLEEAKFVTQNQQITQVAPTIEQKLALALYLRDNNGKMTIEELRKLGIGTEKDYKRYQYFDKVFDQEEREFLANFIETSYRAAMTGTPMEELEFSEKSQRYRGMLEAGLYAYQAFRESFAEKGMNTVRSVEESGLEMESDHVKQHLKEDNVEGITKPDVEVHSEIKHATGVIDDIPELNEQAVNAISKSIKESASDLSKARSGSIIYGSEDIANYQYNMIENPGPLADMPNQPAKNFYGCRYNMEVLQEDKIMYRAGNAENPYGRWFTSESPASVLNVRIDTAVKPQWINPKTGAWEASSYIDYVYAIKIPKGTTVYTGPVGPQGGAYMGGYNVMQTYIDAPWNFEVIGKIPLQ